MRLDIFLYMCIYMCICVIIFDFMFTVSILRNNYFTKKRTKYLKKIMKECLDDEHEYEKHIKKLTRLLKQKSWVLVYLSVYNDYKNNKEIDLKNLKKLNVELLKNVSGKCGHKDYEYQALFSYIVYKVVPYSRDDEKETLDIENLSKVLISFLSSKSVFVRADAFRALVKINKNPKDVFYALTRLNRFIHIRDSKIFSDYLLEFEGDTDALISLLVESILEFSVELQVMIINYMRLLPKEVNQQAHYADLLEMLNNPGVDGETVMVIIRFFGKHYYEDAYKRLVEYLDTDNDTKKLYNYSAVAARALKNYPRHHTIDLLTDKLSSRDWYVRYNCADSLLYMDVDYEKIIFNSNDKYAKDMMIGRSEVLELRKKKRHAL